MMFGPVLKSQIAVVLLLASFALGLSARNVYAIDPPYQGQMQRLLEVLGSLYFLQPLCDETDENWRAQAAELISLDNPDDDRRARLNGAFNSGYASYARLYRACTPSAQQAINRLLAEAEAATRTIHSHFAE